MLMVVLLLPLSLSMYHSEFDHGGGGGGGGQRLTEKGAGNESVDGRMTACDDESGWRKTTQQPTNEGISKSGRWWVGNDGDATAQRQRNGIYDGQRWTVRRQCNGDDSDGARR